jgi:asparagine synthase (glutamine-hydrolysing)
MKTWKQFLMPWRSRIQFALEYPSLYAFCRRLRGEGKTYLSYEKLKSLIDGFTFLRSHKPFVRVGEFGVGRGGSAQLLYRLVTRFGGHLTLYDVFGRIPPPTEKDGPKAAARYADILEREGPNYYGNMENLRGLIESELDAIGPDRRYTIVQGPYEETLSAREEQPPRFDLVHVDCDWYSSVKVALDYLKNRLSPPAILQIDDWSHWEGCRAAVVESGYLRYPHETRGGALVVKVA